MTKERTTFHLGDCIVWDEKNFNPSFWDGLTEQEKDTYYHSWTRDSKGKRIVFVFITEIIQAPGHCVVVPMGNGGRVEWMRHTDEFRLATEDEV